MAEDEVAALREQVESLLKERTQWLAERERMREEIEVLQSRLQKLSQAPPEVAAEAAAPAEGSGDIVDEMLRSPQDEALQLRGIETLFAQQTQAGAASEDASPAMRRSLEAAIAVFVNHQSNWNLLLKASQFLSVLLAEPSAQQLLPQAVMRSAAEAVLASSAQLSEAQSAPSQGAGPTPTKLITWLLSLLALLLPAVEPWLRQRLQSQDFVKTLLNAVVSKLLTESELPAEAVILKSVQLIPLLPMESWIQQACLDSGAIHSFALARQRVVAKKGGEQLDPTLAKAVQSAIRMVFSNNLELCSFALGDSFVGDTFVCLEVLDELQSLEQQRRGTFRRLESEFDVVGKVLSLWAFHQRQTLEDPNPGQCSSLAVLRKVASLLQSLFLKLPPQRLLMRLEEYQESEALVRIALATVHQNAQLRLQMAVNYAENNVIPVMVACLQLLLRGYECSENAADSVPEIEVAFRHLAEEKLPIDGWSYVTYCLEVCLHVLSHWSCLRAAQTKAEALDPGAAPVRLASAGVVDVLAELIDAPAAGVELRETPSAAVVQKAGETLHALFERNGHICLFCMKHYTEVKQILLVGCESIVSDPLSDHPQMQQAIELFSAAFEKFAMKDERLGRKLLKALTVLFESSYQLVVWFLQQHPLGSLSETHSLDAHIEAVRAVARAGYWSAEDAPLLPEFVAALVSTMYDAVEGHLDFSKPPGGSGCRVIDLTEAEEIASSCTSSVLHLMLIDPSPPTVQRCLADCLGKRLTRKGNAGYPAQEKTEDLPPLEDVEASEAPNSEEAVNTVMKIMQVFPSSDRLQMNCQHILTLLLGE